jgi:hypothetical protein
MAASICEHRAKSGNAAKAHEIMAFRHYEDFMAGSAMNYLRHRVTQIAEGPHE